MEPESRVVTEDVRKLLRRSIRSRDEDDGDSVALLAEKAGTSTRTIYRVLGNRSDTLALDLADRLLVACGYHLHDVRVVGPDGKVEGSCPE